MILFSAEAILASSTSKFGKSFRITDREDFSPSKESTISTSVIHDMAADGKSEPFETCVLNRVFHTENDDRSGNWSNCNSDNCCLCCPITEFCHNSTGIVELVVNERSCRKRRYWNCALILSVFTCQTCFHLRLEIQRCCFSTSLHVVG